MQKMNIPTNFQHPTQGQLFLPIAVLLHAHSWFYYGNFQDPLYQTSGIGNGHEHHRHMIMYMVNHGQIITSAKSIPNLLLSESIAGFVNPLFPFENFNVEKWDTPSVYVFVS